ncbi:MAG: ABC transporter substrate-binding protein [Xanthobacteraceae bacterium]
MRRREFILALGAAAAWPLTAGAQPVAGRAPRIGFIQANPGENVTAFMQGLRDAGYIDGQSATIETRHYVTAPERLDDIARELVALKCDVIFAAAPYAIQAALRATSAIPIVGIDLESDPVASGWARNLARPGGNLTGLFLDLPELGGKQIELLKDAVSVLSRPGVLWDATIGAVQFRATEMAARMARVTVLSLPINRSEDLKNAFDTAARERLDGIIVLTSPFIFLQRVQIADLALANHQATISIFTQFPRSGGLMAYGPNLPEMYKRAGGYVDRILKGAKVGDLPIERPTRFELVINTKTAKALGLTIPGSLLARADEVIE